eukprot:14164-Heterococcus_DN1.PRE.3
MPIPSALSAQGALGAHETTFRFRKKWSASDQACAFIQCGQILIAHAGEPHLKHKYSNNCALCNTRCLQQTLSTTKERPTCTMTQHRRTMQELQ